MDIIRLDWHDLASVIEAAREHFGVDKIDYLLEELYEHPQNVINISIDGLITDVDLFAESGDDYNG